MEQTTVAVNTDWAEIISGIAAIITAVGVIIMAWWKYNQSMRDKLTDLKIEKWKKTEKETNYRAVENAARIYGTLWEILYSIKCDRVYILQPHPLINQQFVTITLEVKRKGVSEMKNQIIDLPMGDIAYFIRELVNNEWLYYEDICNIEIDRSIKALMGINGTTQVAIHKLVNVKGDWIGSLFVESANETLFDPKETQRIVESAANSIQYILPAYKS